MANDLEEQIANDLSTAIRDEMDFEILVGMLVQLGWKKVVLTKIHNRKSVINILQWCDEHIKHPFQHREHTFVFLNEGDAINFTLRWI